MKSEIDKDQQQVVLITGASSGIGKATAELFVKHGYRIFGTSRREITGKNGVEMLKLDVRSDDSVKHCIEKVLEKAGKLDILINNAGIMHQGFAEETTQEEAHEVFETNFFGVIRMINAVLPHMRSRKQGRIINISSLAAWIGEPGDSFYSASKHALTGYTEALRHEVWHLNIHVSLIEPGEFQTNVLPSQNVHENLIADYDISRQAVYKTFQKALQKGDDAGKAARLILKVACARNPHLRYGVGRGANWIPYAKVLLPQRLFDYLIRKGFGLNKIF